jgi:hypothetical protein
MGTYKLLVYNDNLYHIEIVSLKPYKTLKSPKKWFDFSSLEPTIKQKIPSEINRGDSLFYTLNETGSIF